MWPITIATASHNACTLQYICNENLQFVANNVCAVLRCTRPKHPHR